MLEFNNITRDPAKLPEASLKALLARGFGHYLGNEQQSKVVSKIKAHLANGGKASDVSKDQVKAFREANPDQVKTWADEAIASALQALDNGTVGVRAPGAPRVDPLTAAMHSIARAEVARVLRASGAKVPKGDETVQLGAESFTLAQLVERRLARPDHGPRIKREAEAKVKADARKAAQVDSEAKSAEVAELL